MGFSISEADKNALLKNLNDYVFNVADALKRETQKPPASEITELLRNVSGAVKTLLGTVDLHEPADEVYRAVGITRRMNPAILEHLSMAAASVQGTTGWRNADLVSCAIRSAAMVGVLAEKRIAQLRAEPPPKATKPEHTISLSMAELYAAAFRKPPTLANGSPWLKFLKWGLRIAGSPTAGSGDDALRKLPIPRANGRGRRSR
jgi:hypothetical protein